MTAENKSNNFTDAMKVIGLQGIAASVAGSTHSLLLYVLFD